MSMVADHHRFIVGVDTHAATHADATPESPSGRLLAQETFLTITVGLARAASWIGRHTEANIDEFLISAECTGSYGAVMSDRLEPAGCRVVEAVRLAKQISDLDNDLKANQVQLVKPGPGRIPTAVRISSVRRIINQAVSKTRRAP